MSRNHEYFEQNPETWSIIDFLNECEVELYDAKINKYTKSLKAIANDKQEERIKKAQLLLDSFMLANKDSFKSGTVKNINNEVNLMSRRDQNENKESVGSAVSKKAKTMKDTPLSSQGVPNPSSSSLLYEQVKTTNTNANDDDSDFISSNKSSISRSHWKDTSSSSLQSLESTGSNRGDTKMMDEVNNPEYNRQHTPPHQIYSTSENQNLLTRLRNEKQRVKFTIDTRNDLQNKLLLLFIPSGETYSFSKYYKMHWIQWFANKLSLFFEAPQNPLLDKNSEG
ncbi:1503_t:CDS:2, partial [Funneliformis caledonium]